MTSAAVGSITSISISGGGDAEDRGAADVVDIKSRGFQGGGGWRCVSHSASWVRSQRAPGIRRFPVAVSAFRWGGGRRFQPGENVELARGQVAVGVPDIVDFGNQAASRMARAVAMALSSAQNSSSSDRLVRCSVIPSLRIVRGLFGKQIRTPGLKA